MKNGRCSFLFFRFLQSPAMRMINPEQVHNEDPIIPSNPDSFKYLEGKENGWIAYFSRELKVNRELLLFKGSHEKELCLFCTLTHFPKPCEESTKWYCAIAWKQYSFFLPGSNTVQGQLMTKPAKLKCERADNLGRQCNSSTIARVCTSPASLYFQSPVLSTSLHSIQRFEWPHISHRKLYIF